MIQIVPCVVCHVQAAFEEILSTLESYFLSESVIISVMTFEGTDCRLADIGKLADATGGRVRHICTMLMPGGAFSTK